VLQTGKLNISEYLGVFSNQPGKLLHLATIDAYLVFAFHVLASIVTFYLGRCVDYDEDMADACL